MATNEEIAGRLLDFAVRVMGVVRALPRGTEARHVARQLLRCGTSPGANYEEACGAESRDDFSHKIGIALKELKGPDSTELCGIWARRPATG